MDLVLLEVVIYCLETCIVVEELPKEGFLELSLSIEEELITYFFSPVTTLSIRWSFLNPIIARERKTVTAKGEFASPGAQRLKTGERSE